MTDTNHIEVLRRQMDATENSEVRAALHAAITALSARASANDTIEKIVADIRTLAGHYHRNAHIVRELVGFADRIEQALSARTSAGEGGEYVLVPRVPTAEMLACIARSEWPQDWESGKRLQREAGCEVVFPKTEIECAVGQYQRMLTAAPQPAQTQAEEQYRGEEWQCCGNEKSGSCCGKYERVWQPVPQCRWPDCGYDGNAVMGGSHCGPNCHAAPQPAQTQGDDDNGSQDAAVWTLIELAEKCGAKKDEDDSSTWWTLDVQAFYSLEEELRARNVDAGWPRPDTSHPAAAQGGMTFAFMAEVCDAAVQAMQANGLIKRTIRLQEVRDQLRILAAAPQPQGGDAVYTEEEVAEAMEVLRGRHGSSALVDEVLDDMERVLTQALAAAPQPQANLVGYEDGSSHGRTTPPAHGDGEAEAFEAWAVSQRYDMQTHPLHWLFLNQETYAARQGWKAGMAYALATETPQARGEGNDHG